MTKREHSINHAHLSAAHISASKHVREDTFTARRGRGERKEREGGGGGGRETGRQTDRESVSDAQAHNSL